jgi:hypothetical protein
MMFTLVFRNDVFLLIIWAPCTQSLLYGQEQVTGSFTDS